MRARTVLQVTVIALIIGACTGGPTQATPAPSLPPSPTPSPAPQDTPRHGVQGLIADLADAGVSAAVDGSFDGQPLAVEGVIVCVSGNDVRVYSYGTAQEALAAAARIDPHDPSNVGSAIIEWNGSPKFWTRDRILVLYLGDDQNTIALLTGLMGEPFASGAGRPQLLPDSCA